MPVENCLMNVGEWVTDLAAISCLGAGLAALVLTLLPGKRLTGKAESADPSSFIDPGAGETARYRLAFKDLITVKNSGLDVTQVSGTVPEPGVGLEGTRAMSASELAITMFDQGILGVGLGEKSLEATKSFSKTKFEKTKVESKTKIDSKTKIEKKVDTKTKIEPRAKEEKPKPESKKDAKKEAKPDPKDQKNQKDQKKDPKKDTKKGEEKDLQLHMAVRKITYGSKKTDPYVSKPVIDENTGEETPDPLKPTYFSEDILDAMDRQPASFLNQSKEPDPSPLPAEKPNAAPGFPTAAGPAQRVPLPPQPPAQGFPQPPAFPIPPQPPAQGFPMPPQPPTPGFPQPPQPPAQGFPVSPQPPTPPQPQNPKEGQQSQPEEIDPSKDPKKVGRSTLIEPKRNLQQDREPPPPEYFK